MSNDTNLTVRPGEDDNHDGLTDEAVLHYQKLAAEEKKKSRGLSGPLPGEGATYTGAAGLGMGAVAFEDRQLHAEVGGAERADDPWGTDEDDYSVPSAVTGAEDDHEDRRKRGTGAMALRGSGTRGGSKSDGSALAGGAPMMGAPGATVGGVGAVGAQPMGGAMPGAQLGLAQNGAVGSMPVGMLQNAQNSSRAATGAVYAPPAGAGPQAASAGPGVYDPEFLREALKANGFTREALDEKTPGVGGIDLVDTDGDGVPDTPRAEAEKSARERGATNPGGMLPGPLPIGGNINGPGPAPTTPGTNPGATTPGTNPPGTNPVPGTTPPGFRTMPGYPPPVATPLPGTNPIPVTGGPAYQPNPVPGTQPGTTTPISAPSTGPIAAGGYTPTNPGGRDIDFAQQTPTYSGSGRNGYSVNSDDLRSDSKQWVGVAESTAPVADAIISTASPATMFGHMTDPVPTYQSAVDSSRDFVSQSGESSLAFSQSLDETASNFDEQELAAIAETGKVF